MLMYFICQGLFLGSIGAANNKNALKSLNVTHILTVASSLPPAHPNDFVYKVINGINFFFLVEMCIFQNPHTYMCVFVCMHTH